jgi:serine/threonine protein kinase
MDITIGRVIGTGGFGTVHEGTYLNSKVAIKKILLSRNLELTRRECESMMQFNHRNVLKLIHVYKDQCFRF